jgi:hypothetical protein
MLPPSRLGTISAPNGTWPCGQRQRVGQFVDHADFQGGGAAEDVLGLGGVLHAGQLHHDAAGALLLDHRFGHAEFVDAIAQGGDVLLQGKFLHLLLGFRLQA